MRGKIDLNDAVVSPFFVIASMVSVGLASFTPFGIDFADTLFTFGASTAAPADFSLAKLIALAALVVAYASNKPDISKMGAVETWAALATLGFVLTPPFMPAVEGLLQSSAVAGLIAVIVQAGGFYSLSYLG